ncbi:unnamed protein product [Merluccius merluccius]
MEVNRAPSKRREPPRCPTSLIRRSLLGAWSSLAMKPPRGCMLRTSTAAIEIPAAKAFRELQLLDKDKMAVTACNPWRSCSYQNSSVSCLTLSLWAARYGMLA